MSSAREAVELWAPLAGNPQLAALRGAFVSDQAGGGRPALFFVHDYHALAVTLDQVRIACLAW
jgi:hypothetical protein